jgi:hypothetical protein
MKQMEIMRKDNDSFSSTTVSSTTVLAERGNAETTKTMSDTMFADDNNILTTVPGSSTIIRTTLQVEENEILTSEKEPEITTLPSDFLGEVTNDIDNEAATESPDNEMYETSTVIATSISTSEAISYFNPENLPKLENVKSYVIKSSQTYAKATALICFNCECCSYFCTRRSPLNYLSVMEISEFEGLRRVKNSHSSSLVTKPGVINN